MKSPLRLLLATLGVLLALVLSACGALDEGDDGKDVAEAEEGATPVRVGYLHTIAATTSSGSARSTASGPTPASTSRPPSSTPGSSSARR